MLSGGRELNAALYPLPSGSWLRERDRQPLCPLPRCPGEPALESSLGIQGDQKDPVMGMTNGKKDSGAQGRCQSDPAEGKARP